MFQFARSTSSNLNGTPSYRGYHLSKQVRTVKTVGRRGREFHSDSPNYRFIASPLVITFFLVVLLLASGCGGGDKKEEGELQTANIRRGDLLVSISATGTLEPEEVIDVGAQVAGKILSFGTDREGKAIDYGSQVDEGTVLARIDDSLYAAEVAQAKARLRRAEAEVLRAKAKLFSAERDWQRAQSIGPSEALSKSAFDTYRAQFESAQAEVQVAVATVAQEQAALERSERNLTYCTIQSPVKGTIIDKRVNIGQTVVSSLNAPSLFLLARDLTRMEVWVSVNEADIGNIYEGQRVTYTVDAFPGEEFSGVVGKIRLNASMTQNVVTYLVEVQTENRGGKLLPYLTANAKFEVSNSQGVFLVPNSALRWSPPVREGEEETRSETRLKEGEGRLWTVRDGEFSPLVVRLGGTDGVSTAVSGEGVKEGVEVVVGAKGPGGERGTVNPFAPSFQKRR